MRHYMMYKSQAHVYTLVLFIVCFIFPHLNRDNSIYNECQSIYT